MQATLKNAFEQIAKGTPYEEKNEAEVEVVVVGDTGVVGFEDTAVVAVEMNDGQNESNMEAEKTLMVTIAELMKVADEQAHMLKQRVCYADTPTDDEIHLKLMCDMSVVLRNYSVVGEIADNSVGVDDEAATVKWMAVLMRVNGLPKLIESIAKFCPDGEQLPLQKYIVMVDDETLAKTMAVYFKDFSTGLHAAVTDVHDKVMNELHAELEELKCSIDKYDKDASTITEAMAQENAEYHEKVELKFNIASEWCRHAGLKAEKTFCDAVGVMAKSSLLTVGWGCRNLLSKPNIKDQKKGKAMRDVWTA